MKNLLLLLVLLLTACTSSREQRVVIGSKFFTEQVVLAELLAQHIETRTALPVERRFSMGATLICHQALLSGDIDAYVEYTGTALTAVLGQQASREPAQVLEHVREGYARRFNLEVTEPLGFNNTFALVIRGEDARNLKLRTISDLARVAPRWRAGFGYEFNERPDGFKGLAAAYRLKLAEPPRVMELGLIYQALKEKHVDVVAGNSTDGLISALDLVALEDDRHYFPPYDAVPVVRRQTLARHPALREALRSLAGKLTEEDMRRLNYAVDGEHRDVRQVVRDFLRAKPL
jgi:glycine betaine/choline ABC-type transport system substrate-binding protein